MEKEDRERLVRVEVGITSLTELVKDHIKADCAALGCQLHDDVQSLKQTQITTRRVSWVALTGILITGLRYSVKGLFNV